MKLQNIWYAGYDIIGSDFNKIYDDHLYDYTTKLLDPNKPSFTSTFIQAQPGNKFMASWSTLVGTNGYTPLASSPLLTAASFVGLNGFTPVSYVGAFGPNDTWATGWTEFDPQNATY